MSYSKRAFQRTVVLSERKRAVVPGNAEMSPHINTRRVMDIAFTKGKASVGESCFSCHSLLLNQFASGCKLLVISRYMKFLLS